MGRVATLLCKDNPELLAAINGERPVTLVVESGIDNKYRIIFRMGTVEEMLAAKKQGDMWQKESEDARTQFLFTKYTPKKSIITEVRAPESVIFQKDQRLVFKPKTLDLGVTSRQGQLEILIWSTGPLAYLRICEQALTSGREFSGRT